MSVPRLSVLLPVYNAESTIERCLRSLSCQTFRDFEVLLLDDGSTDESASFLKRWSADDVRFQYHRCRHAGIVATLNYGRKVCRGRLLARLDADDTSPPDRFERQVAALDGGDVDVVSGHVVGVGDQRGYLRYVDWLNSLMTHEAMFRERFIESPLAHPSIMMKTQSLDEAMGYRRCGYPEDYDLWLRLFAKGCRFSKVKATVLHWYDSPSRLSRIDRSCSRDAFLNCRVEHLVKQVLRPDAKQSQNFVIWGAGPNGKKLARALEAYDCTPEFFVDIDPKKLGRPVRQSTVLGLEALHRMPARVLIAVGALGAREKIRQALNRYGLVEGENAFFCL